LISKPQERPITCKSGVPTQDGGRSLSIRENISATFNRLTDALMLQETKIKKVKLFKFTTNTMELTRDGRFSILTRKQRLKLKDSMRNSVSISTDHSTWYQSFLSTELQSAMVPTTSG
jgi:hypothetical protein